MRRALILGDSVFVLVGFVLPLMMLVDVKPRNAWFWLAEVATITAGGVVSVRYQGLWTQRVISVRMLELSRIPRAFAVMSLLVLIIDRKATMNVRVWDLVVANVAAIVGFIVWRSAYRVIIAAERRRGRLCTKVAIVGSGRRAFELRSLFNVHPDLGLRVVRMIGRKSDMRAAGAEHLWAGELADAPAVLAAVDADLVIVCSVDLDESSVRAVTHAEWAQGRALYVDAGLPGVDFRRVRATALAHQPLLEVERPTLPVLEQVLKRAFDIAVAGFLILMALPMAAVIAAAIKLEDGGPVFFKQRRVGLHGAEFGIYKFRTMAIDAEQRLAELKARNERVGPLFKMDDRVDPRITRIGRFLRGFSIDELPQLINVVRGEMSLVGPRPALPAETAEFPADLMARHDVRPGITGLWQVEARDNASFDAYRRLDLFYVENWSLAFDVMILIATVDHVLFRPLLSRMYRGEERRMLEPATSIAPVRHP